MSAIAIDKPIQYTTIRLIQKLRNTTADFCHQAADKLEENDHRQQDLKDEIWELKRRVRKLEGHLAESGWYKSRKAIDEGQRYKVLKRTHIMLQDIKRLICEYYAIEMSELVGKKRSRHLVWPRQVYSHMASELVPSATVKDIGRSIHRDHSTVLHSRSKVADIMDAYPEKHLEVVQLINEWNVLQQSQQEEAV